MQGRASIMNNTNVLKWFYFAKIKECDELKEEVIKLRIENEELKRGKQEERQHG